MPSIIRHSAPVFLLAACACAFADVTVEAPWIRGVVAGQSSTGAFMTLRSTDATELVAMSSPAAESLQVHKTAMVDGMMTMEPVDALAVPAHGSVTLEPGGFHVMLVGLRVPLRPGDKVPLTLTFRGADRHESAVTVQAEVRDVTGAPSHGKR
jgi:hypothetical protein